MKKILLILAILLLTIPVIRFVQNKYNLNDSSLIMTQKQNDLNDSILIMEQRKYILNDCDLMMKMKFCYCGDSVVVYNGLQDEFYAPLPKCSEGSYHTFIIDSTYYVVYPDALGYNGSAGDSFFLFKRKVDKFTQLDNIFGYLDLAKMKSNSSTFYYVQADKSTIPFKDYEYEFIIDKQKEKFQIKTKKLVRIW